MYICTVLCAICMYSCLDISLFQYIQWIFQPAKVDYWVDLCHDGQSWITFILQKRYIYIYTYMGMYKQIYTHSVYISSQCIRETHEFMNEVFMYS